MGFLAVVPALSLSTLSFRCRRACYDTTSIDAERHMARVSTVFSLLVLTLAAALLLIPRDGAGDRRASFAASGTDTTPTGSISQAARAKHARDTLAP